MILYPLHSLLFFHFLHFIYDFKHTLQIRGLISRKLFVKIGSIAMSHARVIGLIKFRVGIGEQVFLLFGHEELASISGCFREFKVSGDALFGLQILFEGLQRVLKWGGSHIMAN